MVSSGVDLRSFFLAEEVQASIRLIERGLAELQSISAANAFYFPAMLLLSTGLERFMKCVLCLRAKERTGLFPSLKEIKDYGHDLAHLHSAVVIACFERGYRSSRPAAESDASFLVSDEHLGSVLTALTRFATSGRYYNLDIVGGAPSRTGSPDEEWGQLEMAIIRARPGAMDGLLSEGSDRALTFVGQELVIRIERFVRALCRLFTLGPLGTEGRALSGVLGPFLFLMDGDLGQRDYRVRTV